MSAPAVVATPDPIMERVEDQIGWYDRKSLTNQQSFKRIKVFEIIAAAMIPFLAGFPVFKAWAWVTALLGVLITISEGILHLNQNQQNWANYRSTCEALKHEKFLYLAKAGPYASASNPHALLSERAEAITSQENAKWTALQQPEKKN